MRTGIVVAALAVIALVWFNPDMDDFRLFIETRTEDLIRREAGETPVGGALSRLGSNLAGAYIGEVTDRNNYVVFSTYTIDLDGQESETGDWRFVGIGGRFIETERPESLPGNE